MSPTYDLMTFEIHLRFQRLMTDTLNLTSIVIKTFCKVQYMAHTEGLLIKITWALPVSSNLIFLKPIPGQGYS